MNIPSAAAILSDRQIRELCEVPYESREAIRSAVYADMAFQVTIQTQIESSKMTPDKAGLYGLMKTNEEINRRFQAQALPMIRPFEPGQVRTRHAEQNPWRSEDQVAPEPEKIISYGLSSYGYDVRCGKEFKIFTNVNSSIVDPKNFDEKCFVDIETDVCIIPPNSFVLARTVETFRIPRDVLVVCLGKSTYARCGIIVNVTPLEPEWEGQVTLEFSNTTPLPAKIYANEGVAQMLFFRGSEACEVSYKDRGGKYQGQTGVVVPRT